MFTHGKVCIVLDKPDPNEPVVGEGDIHVDDGPTIELPTLKKYAHKTCIYTARLKPDAKHTQLSNNF